jgi:hypothetical protein
MKGLREEGYDERSGRRAPQPKGEIPLQIRCRCSDGRLSLQFVIVVRGNRSVVSP